jgi:7-cyano-7-deazaguanine synthase in queuosine biosynthesis
MKVFKPLKQIGARIGCVLFNHTWSYSYEGKDQTRQCLHCLRKESRDVAYLPWTKRKPKS